MSRHPEAKILFIDDEQNVLTALGRAFIDEEYQIFTATSGEEGLAAFMREGPFQVVISDYRMPHMNGDEFLREVYERWPESKRVVLSGYADVSAIVAAINKGHIYKFLPKPWDDDELRMTVRHCLDLYYLHQRNRDLLAELELCQEVLTNLPAGVLAIDDDNRVIYCHEAVARQLPDALYPLAGSKYPEIRDSALLALAAQVRADHALTGKIVMNGREFQVWGRTALVATKNAVILVLQESSS